MAERNYTTLKPDAPDDRDYMFMASGTEEYPETDLRGKDIAEVFNQFSLGACGSFGITETMMYWQKQNTPSHYYFYLSQLFLYWKTREIQGTIDWDSGITIREGLKTAQQFGVCRQYLYPYEIANYKKVPTFEAIQDAANYKINSYHRIMTVNQLKAALAEGNPVIVGIEVWSSFENLEVESTGFVPIPNKTKESLLGYHCMLILGWKEIKGIEYMIVKNSYGSEFGDKGFIYIPMDFIGRYVTDMWVAK